MEVVYTLEAGDIRIAQREIRRRIFVRHSVGRQLVSGALGGVAVASVFIAADWLFEWFTGKRGFGFELMLGVALGVGALELYRKYLAEAPRPATRSTRFWA